MRDVAGCVLLSYAGGIFVGNLGLLLSNQGLHTGVAGEPSHSCRAFGGSPLCTGNIFVYCSRD